jgi:hypothetical protein
MPYIASAILCNKMQKFSGNVYVSGAIQSSELDVSTVTSTK